MTAKKRVLFVDDDENILNGLKRRLYKKYSLDTAPGAEKGLALIENCGPYAVVISDQQMPGCDGITFLTQVKDKFPFTTRIMLTGNADKDTAIQAVNDGQVFRYLNKPCSIEELSAAIDEGVKFSEKKNKDRLLLEKTLKGSINLLLEILEYKEPETAQSVGIMRTTAGKIAKAIKHPNLWELDMTIMLSPLGNLMIPDELRIKVSKKEPLSSDEQDTLEMSPQIAKDLLANIPHLIPVSKALYYQNKAYDGSGYPNDDIKGDSIPQNARILYLLQSMVKASNGKPPTKEHFLSLMSSPERFDPKLVEAARSLYQG